MIRRLLLYVVAGFLALAVLAAGALYWFLSNDGIRIGARTAGDGLARTASPHRIRRAPSSGRAPA